MNGREAKLVVCKTPQKGWAEIARAKLWGIMKSPKGRAGKLEQSIYNAGIIPQLAMLTCKHPTKRGRTVQTICTTLYKTAAAWQAHSSTGRITGAHFITQRPVAALQIHSHSCRWGGAGCQPNKYNRPATKGGMTYW